MALKTPDRFPGPREDEEIILDDRIADGDPIVEGAIRYIDRYLRLRASELEQILTARNYPTGFINVNLQGLVDTNILVYDDAAKEFKPGVSNVSDFSNHEILDTLTHQIVEDSYDEVLRECGKVVGIIVWTDVTKTVKIRETQITRTAGKVSQVIDIQYGPTGSEDYRVVEDITRVDGVVSSVDRVRI